MWAHLNASEPVQHSRQTTTIKMLIKRSITRFEAAQQYEEKRILRVDLLPSILSFS